MDRVNVLRNSHDQWDYTVKAKSEQAYISPPAAEPILYDLKFNSSIQQFKSSPIDVSAYSPTSPGINPTTTFNLLYPGTFVNQNIVKKRKLGKNLSVVMSVFFFTLFKYYVQL